MKVSILVPTYDTPPALLLKALMSVIDQKNVDWEIIIKDGSPRNPAIGSAEVANLIYHHKQRIGYYCGWDGPKPEDSGYFKHNGFYEALNECVRQSTGDILCLMCADDERGDPDTLAHVVEQFPDKEPRFLYGACEWIGQYNEHIAFKQPPVVPVTFESLLRDYTLYTPSLFWSRSVHTKFGLFDHENYPWCADLDFWLRCWRGMESKFTPRVVGKYRVWGTSQARANEHLLGEESLKIQMLHRMTL